MLLFWQMPNFFVAKQGLVWIHNKLKIKLKINSMSLSDKHVTDWWFVIDHGVRKFLFNENEGSSTSN